MASVVSMPLPVTGVVTGVLASVQSVLSARVGLQRFMSGQRYGILKGSEEQSLHFERTLSAHQSSAEYSPIFLLTLAGLEANKVIPRRALVAVGLLFTTARVCHSLALGAPQSYPHLFRRIGYWSQLLLTIGGGVTLAVAGLKALARD